MKKLVLAVVLMGALTACSQQPTDTSSPSDSSNQSSSEQSTTQPQQNTDQQDLADYHNQINAPFSTLLTDVQTVNQLVAEGSQNPGELTTQDYQDRVQQACNTMENDAQAVEDIPTPSNPKVAAIAKEVLLGVDQVKFVAENLPTGVDNMDVNTINSCTQAFQNGATDFNQATSLENEFNQQ